VISLKLNVEPFGDGSLRTETNTLSSNVRRTEAVQPEEFSPPPALNQDNYYYGKFTTTNKEAKKHLGEYWEVWKTYPFFV